MAALIDVEGLTVDLSIVAAPAAEPAALPKAAPADAPAITREPAATAPVPADPTVIDHPLHQLSAPETLRCEKRPEVVVRRCLHGAEEDFVASGFGFRTAEGHAIGHREQDSRTNSLRPFE